MTVQKILKGKKILVFNQDQDIQASLTDLLQPCKLSSASTLTHAKKLFNNLQFDLAIIDIDKKGAFKLLDIVATSNFPVVILSEHPHSSEHATNAYEKGASYYVPKEKIIKIATYLSDVLEAVQKGESPWSTWLERMEGLTNRNLMNHMKRDKVPLHHYFDEITRDIPFEFNRRSNMSPISQAFFPHRHSFYEIFHIEKGRGTHVIDFQPYQVKAGSMFFISPGQVHFWQLDEPFEGSVILFNENFLFSQSQEQSLINELDFFHNAVGSPYLLLNSNQDKSLKEVIRKIENEYKMKSYRYQSMLQSCLRMLIIEIQRIINANTDNRNKEQPAIINNFKKMVSENFIKQKAVPYYAKKLTISESHLFNIVKKQTGITPGQIIHNEVIIEAKRQLAHTDFSISEICYKLDFEDPSYFSRFFRRETGMSPKVFRRNIREKYQI